MAEFQISRIRYTWKGTWATALVYNRDDVVRYGGSSWVCVRQHTASAFQTNQDFLANAGDSQPTPAWIKMADGFAWRGDWTDGTLYNPGDLALYGGVIYLAVVSHTSDVTFSANSSKWTEYVTLDNWTSIWLVDTRYGIGDVVRYNGIVYRCVTEHTSSSPGLEPDQAKWETVHEGIQIVGTWTEAIQYRKNDLVKYGGTLLRCTIGHTAESYINNSNFVTEFPGLNFYQTWSDSVYYAVGDIVRHGGYVYVANYNHTDVNPSLSIYAGGVPSGAWSLLAKASRLLGDYSTETNYKTGDVVRRGGYVYICLADTEITDDGSSLDYLDSSNWEIVIPGFNWRNFWQTGTEYSINDIVLYRGAAYACNTQHTSAVESFPGDNGNGFYFWNLLSEAGDNVALSSLGELLTFGLSRSAAGDQSTIATTGLAPGSSGQLVVVGEEDVLEYTSFGHIEKVVYVELDGIDDRESFRGIDQFRPYKTLRWALEIIGEREDFSQITVRVGPGVFYEVLPLRVPAGVTVEGTELRTTTISPKLAFLPANDVVGHLSALNKLFAIIPGVMGLTPITPSSGNAVSQVLNPVLRGETYVDPETEISSELDPVFDATASTRVRAMIDDVVSYINYYVNGIGSDPTIVSTNTETNHTEDSNWAVYNSRLILEANREFLIAEIEAYMTVSGFSYDAVYFPQILDIYISAFKKDLRYVGNYNSIYSARYYRNLNLGSQLDDMFYVRNSTGAKNCTLKGLSGVLNPPAVFEQYQRPTGGAFVSLDPGWGPADTSTWITTRSPYIQNVTTFGDNCTGQKIDGALHDGGNKSIVSNDFTQVISDGIGAWVLNNGRAELVSVFTYYAQIGMFAELGGVIRAANGNSSYGSFGAIADGNDPTETPAFAEVNTRLNQAIVAAAFAGEVNDEILILEYRNAGQNYSGASFTFTGSGTQANAIFEEIRDDSVFEALVKNAPGDPGGTEGAGGYTNIGNNAQFGDTTSLTLASNSDFVQANLLGLRLIITSGSGAGQYGYVIGYNNSTKKCLVARESDNVPGWDHVNPGTPSVTSLFTDNTYRFEPRPVFSAPPFSQEVIDVGVINPWANVVYGETTSTFVSVAGTGGGDNVADDATFNIVKTGRTYSVTLVNPGAGYTIGETITVSGDILGGVTPENDCLIEVRAVSEDSTNTLAGFRVTGIAASGKFVATASSGADFSYSDDGETWTVGSFPAAGNFGVLASGNNAFIAIGRGSNRSLRSTDGVIWTASTNLPFATTWNGLTHGYSTTGTSVWLTVAGTADRGAYSTDNGATWTSTTLPDIGDSTFNEWVDVAYGKNKFIAVANSGNFVAVGQYNSLTNTWSWSPEIMDVIADSSVKDWKSITYGSNKWVAVSGTGEVAYSYTGLLWYPSTMPSQDGSTPHNWKQIRYGQGVFFAVGNTDQRVVGDDLPNDVLTTFAAKSEDGVTWNTITLSTNADWQAVGFGNPDISLGDSTTQSNSTGTWILVANNESSGERIYTGTRTKGRVIVVGTNISEIRLWEPGSGYRNGGPSLTLVDPVNTSDAYVEIRLGDAVLAQPGWVNRGNGYRTSSTVVTVLGNGFADVIPTGQNITISGLPILPGPGTQFRFRGASNFYTVQVAELVSTQYNATLTGRFRITPVLTLDDFLEHTSQVEVRERYSQVRITGHDFLDIGTGNFTETNYPTLYSEGTFTSAPENEVQELDGGRVFYTSTDQNGNFRVGNLFAVEQATGVVTISADFFDFGGLTELALGGVRLGGSGAVVREFSTDPLFTQDSNNVIPTQRAIRAYLQNRLNVGGSDLLTASFIAGTVKVGPGEINNVAGLEVLFLRRADFSGAGCEISGSIMAQTMFFRSFE